MAVKEVNVAHSLDCDGVIVGRIPVQMDAIRGHKELPLPAELPEVNNRFIDQTPLSLLEYSIYLMHVIRRVKPEAIHVVRFVNRYHEDIYLNTGRPNREPYVRLTYHQLEKARIAPFLQDFYFCPPGVSSAIGKILCLDKLRENYDIVFHYDDNELTNDLIKRYFREIRGVNNVVPVQVKDWSGWLTKHLGRQTHSGSDIVVADNALDGVRKSRYIVRSIIDSHALQ